MGDRQRRKNMGIIWGSEQEKETNGTYLMFKTLIQYYFPEIKEISNLYIERTHPWEINPGWSTLRHII